MNEITLYHGSYMEVPAVDFSKCHSGLDFGKGFYLTSSKEQAVNFVPNSIRKAVSKGLLPRGFSVNDGVISRYRLTLSPALSILQFPTADISWLHFVAAHRSARLFPDIVKKYADCDIIVGKIANDQTAATLNAYISGIYGTPGDEDVDRFVIRKLLPNRLKDQYCIRTAKALKYLTFIGSETYGTAAGHR